MKATFTLKNLTDQTLAEIAATPSADAFAKLSKWSFGDLKHCVSQKIETGAFRDRVELNSLIKRGASFQHRIEPRRGYKLVTFEITKA